MSMLILAPSVIARCKMGGAARARGKPLLALTWKICPLTVCNFLSVHIYR